MLIIYPKPQKFLLLYSGPHKILEILNEGFNIKISYRNSFKIVKPEKLLLTRLRDDSDSETDNKSPLLCLLLGENENKKRCPNATLSGYYFFRFTNDAMQHHHNLAHA